MALLYSCHFSFLWPPQVLVLLLIISEIDLLICSCCIHVTAIKCDVDASLEKTVLTPTIEPNKDFVEALYTMTSSCNLQGQNERFEDGLTMERIKCTSVMSSGKWSHEEYSCTGISNVYFGFHIKFLKQAKKMKRQTAKTGEVGLQLSLPVTNSYTRGHRNKVQKNIRLECQCHKHVPSRSQSIEISRKLAEINVSLAQGRCRLTACRLGSAVGPMLGNEYGENFTVL